MPTRFPVIDLPTPHGASPLAQYLARFLAQSKGSELAFDIVPSVMEGALALAAAHPFDPNEIVRPQNQSQEWTLLEALLDLANASRHDGSLHAWPAQVEGFDASLVQSLENTRGKPKGIDNEFVAAMLTAAGANPWHGFYPSEECLTPAVDRAVKLGLAGLLDRFLDHPASPTAQWVADVEGVWLECASQARGNGVLDVLLRRGARITHEDLLVRVIGAATPRAVELLTQDGPLNLSAAAKNRVEAAWKIRARQGSLSLDDAKAMQLSSWGSLNAKLSPAAIEIGNELSVEWTDEPYEPSKNYTTRVRSHLPNAGIARLNQVAQIKGGPLSGKWSLLAAAAFHRVRQIDHSGVDGWDVAGMLSSAFDQEKRKWKSADCNEAPWKGSLAPALGFEWRPGIRIDGPLMLALFGQKSVVLLHAGPTASELETVARRNIRAFAAATGQDDVRQWAVEAAPDAAALKETRKSPTPRCGEGCILEHRKETFAHFRRL